MRTTRPKQTVKEVVRAIHRLLQAAEQLVAAEAKYHQSRSRNTRSRPQRHRSSGGPS